MDFHELANIFPMLPAEELEQLIDDVKCNGLLEPITTFENKILDGRNRFVACQSQRTTVVQATGRQLTLIESSNGKSSAYYPNND